VSSGQLNLSSSLTESDWLTDASAFSSYLQQSIILRTLQLLLHSQWRNCVTGGLVNSPVFSGKKWRSVVRRHPSYGQTHIVARCFSKIFQTRSDDVIAECMLMFKCLPVAGAISRRKRNFFCHGSASVITFYVISAVLLHQLSSDYGHYITF